MKLKFLFVLIIGLFLSGCDYKFSETPRTEENGNISNSRTNQNSDNQTTAANADVSAVNSKPETINSSEPLILSGTSESGNFPCGGREVEIVSDATANSYTLTGECNKLTVDGVSNTVNVEKVGEITVTGTSNKVVYGEGINGKNPKIKKSGVSTAVDSKKSIEDKKNRENQ